MSSCELQSQFPFEPPQYRDGDQRVCLQIGLSTTLYFENGLGLVSRERVRQCLDLYLAAARPQLRWITTPDGSQWEEITDAGIEAYREALANPDLSVSWELQMHGAERADECSDFMFELFAQESANDELSYLRFFMPLTWIDKKVHGYFQLTYDICQLLQPYHGYGGCGFLESADLEVKYIAQPLIHGLAQRFPGIEVDRPLVHLMHVHKGIKGVNWLTVLGPPWVKKMGGVDVLRKALPEQFLFYPVGEGLLIQAGPVPQLGDRNQKLWVEHYPTLARLLKPIRVKEHGCFDHAGPHRFTPETTMEWLTRFDRDPW